MPTRLWAALLVSCLMPAVGECVAPFVASTPDNRGFVPDTSERLSMSPRRPSRGSLPPRRLSSRRPVPSNVPGTSAGPLLMPINDGGPSSIWVYPFTERQVWCSDGFIWMGPGLRLAILQPSKTPSLRLDSRRMRLHLDTAGVGAWDTAIVELWLTRDGWTWQRYQHTLLDDSLLVTLPEGGGYGLRVVVHRTDGPASPKPRSGDAPQVWVEIDETPVAIKNVERSWLDKVQTAERAGEVIQPKESGLPHPHADIKRVEAEKMPIPTWPTFVRRHFL